MVLHRHRNNIDGKFGFHTYPWHLHNDGRNNNSVCFPLKNWSETSWISFGHSISLTVTYFVSSSRLDFHRGLVWIFSIPRDSGNFLCLDELFYLNCVQYCLNKFKPKKWKFTNPQGPWVNFLQRIFFISFDFLLLSIHLRRFHIGSSDCY